MEFNLNFVLLEELEESPGNGNNVARLIVLRGNLDASLISQEDWIRLDSIE